MSKKAALIGFIVSALLALGVLYFMFEMRYMWYVTADDARFMRLIYAACIAVILFLWAFLPSRVAVALVGTFGLFFPHVFYATNDRPLLGRGFDLQALGVAALAIGLLVLATQLRRKTALKG